MLGMSHTLDVEPRIPGWSARHRPESSELIRNHVLSFLQKAFYYLLEHRITASELLEDPSFKAVMEICQC
jgi:hypothetical protein